MTLPTISTPSPFCYSIPSLLTELSPSEGLLQAFDALETLDNAINHAFQTIHNRISVERSKMSSISDRIKNAHAKVQSISSNSARVTTIFSTAKYPGAKTLPDFQRLFENNSSTNGELLVPITHANVKISNSLRLAPPTPADTTVLFTALSRARLLRTEKENFDDPSSEETEGLGRLPSYLPSISSILLFNSDENPYKQYVTINNLEGVGGEDRAQILGGPSAAPKSILEGVELPTFAGFTFEYKPLLGELPEIAMPQNLPLGKLADISFGLDSSFSIAPSITSTLSLPNLDQLQLPMPTRPPQMSAVPSASGGTTQLQIAGGTTAPPPPAPAAAAPKAPPPPNAPPPPSAPSAPVPPPPSGIPAAAAAPSGSRGALLDAIRNSGNKNKLKRVAKEGGGGKVRGGAGGGDKKTAAAAAAAPPPSDGGGDMMEALRLRLARRHDAISGKKVEDKVELPKSGVIPPTPARRVSLAPRKPGAGSNGSMGLLAGLKKSAAVDEGDEEGGGDEEDNGGGASKPALNANIMAAHMAAHSKKTAADEEWE